MRVSGLLPVIAVVTCLSPLTSTAQTAAQRRAAASAAAEEQTEPYHKHRDTRHGHDHYYPDRGAIVRDLPVGTIGTSYAGVSYRYHDGIWLEPRGPAYMVVSPPLGLIAPTLPLYSTVVAHGPESFLYCNDTYYRPRPDLGGYEVVNDPAMEAGAPPAAPEALVGGQMPAAGAPSGGTGAIAAGGGVGLVGAAAVPVAAREGNFVREAGVPREVGAPREAIVQREASVPREAGPVRETGPAREAALLGGAMPGVGAAAASVPPPSLGAGVGASAPVAPAAAMSPGSVDGGSSAAAVGSGSPAGGSPAAVGAVAAAVGAAPVGPAGTPKVPKVFLYPRNGQSADQQARDRYDCYRFAVSQSGFDPMRSGANPPPPGSEAQSDFERAQSACFEGRGYTNR
ncbi:MAG: hypothetical protein JSR66_14135 [Proteobacteria bacterium]|nr:hypothetical protein [Pseudomonadota bacterium]